MRRLLPLTLALALVVAACGDDDSVTTTTAAPGTTAADTTAPATTVATTTAAPTTTVAPTTTTAPATTVDPSDARVAAAAAFAGEYTGEWQNATFGTTGNFDATVDVDEAAKFAIVTVDIDGGVFGGPDPDPFLFEIDLTQDPPYRFTTDLLGEATLDVSEDGTVRLEAPQPPNLGGAGLLVEGSLLGDIRYEVNDGAGTVFAEGVLVLE